MQRAIRISAVAVRVVRPHRIELAAKRGHTNVVTKVDAVAGVGRVREAATQASVRRKGRATVSGEGAVVFRIIIWNHVGAARTGYAVVIATIMKAYCYRAGRGVEGNVRQKLTVSGRIIVDPHRSAPRCAVVSRRAHLNVGVIALVREFVCVNEIDSIVERSTGGVPNDPGLSVDRTSALRR